jgi:hypothetical protein
MHRSSEKTLKETLARLREIAHDTSLRKELKAERQQEKVRERKLQKNCSSGSDAPEIDTAVPTTTL